MERARTQGALLIALVVAFLARGAIGAVYAKLGHPGATLDDSFIHFQYARAIAELHPLRYQAGEAISTGATSLLWPTLLAPFYAVGFRDLAILWPAWALSFAALGMLAHEAHALARPLAGHAAAVGAGAMVLAFGGFVWCAASGMEVVPFAWALARLVRRSSEWSEDATRRTRRDFWEIVVMAWAASLLRPEGAVFALVAVVALSQGPLDRRSRGLALLPLLVPLLVPLLLRLLVGSAQLNTAGVKLLPGNPYFPGPALRAAVGENVRLLGATLLNGEVWSAEFLPSGGAPIAFLGLLALPVSGFRRGLRFRALAVLALALAMVIPCFYVTFLWNRLRYLWPFATGWFVGLACLARVLGNVFAAAHPRWRVVTPLTAGAFAGMFATRMGGVLDDVAGSASGIDRQHVHLGRWAKAHLPEDARLGVNDTGAIAYASDRHTFDIVGLTTTGEGRYWVAGAASRFEHYERLRVRTPERLPTHFIVYREWLACDAILGDLLHEVTVNDATILGGTTMGVYVANYDLLGSGERPWTGSGPIVDSLDVADLESESDHAYDLAGAHDNEEVLRHAEAPAGAAVVDGGRGSRTRERFEVKLPEGIAARGIVRLEAPRGTRLRVLANGNAVGEIETTGDWDELAFAIPPGEAKTRTVIELRSTSAPFAVYHYWFNSPG